MNLRFDLTRAKGYKSSSQISRVLTENWVAQNSYCPSCGSNNLSQFGNNSPVADFLCGKCEAEYELKSKKDKLTLKVVDGAYDSMIRRINSRNNPHFFFLHYSQRDWEVLNFLVIPGHFFVSDMIERRKPLGLNARRAGWIGCNILLESIPSSGRIFLVKDRKPERKQKVRQIWDRTSFLQAEESQNRGWTIEIMRIVDTFSNLSFTLQDIYAFEPILKTKFPMNNFIKDKIRQQLQVLRDKGLLEFKGKGSYVKVQ
ncbi:MAG: DpnI domain-containing protein [Bacteroidota bacterium]